jgi:hypothetical protein
MRELRYWISDMCGRMQAKMGEVRAALGEQELPITWSDTRVAEKSGVALC